MLALLSCFKAYQVGGERISPACQIADRRAAKKHAGNKEKSSLSHVEIKRWAKSFDRACGNLPNISVSIATSRRRL